MKNIIVASVLATCGTAWAQGTLYTGAADCRIVHVMPQAGEHAEWNGPCKDGYADGPGALQWIVNGKETDRYEGYLAQGLPNGKGVYERANGRLYQGTYKNGQLDGQGLIAYPDGEKLVAKFVEGRFVAPVKFHWTSGDIYEGEWNNGPHGVGTKTFALGGSYRGHWKNNKPVGDGEIVYPNGQVLKAQFTGTFQPGVQEEPENEGGAYRARRDHAATGSHIIKSVSSGYRVPIEKSYAAMTAKQQQLVKEPYEILQADDVPPYPVFGKAELIRKLSYLAGRADATGSIAARVWVDEKGVPQSVTVERSENKEFSEYFAQALMVTKFTAGRCAGKPCALAVPFAFNFTQSEF